MANPKRTAPRIALQIDAQLERRLKRLHKLSSAGSGFVSLSDVIRDVLAAGLERKESEMVVNPDLARAAGAA